ncbi:MAG TPA: DUF2281 domain-containing protein [Saprospiraceae bacterium]|nr:DUF2281 domain-containing protein [Saprospiraceae bacterium]HRJ13618.1 DUF2281 domain-containing protein [Saprospiraceae bacterium]HRK82163.1 DUF2281 domain-containing protein [Saprospiraceae bacterium]
MFELILRTDNQAALQKLLEYIDSLNFQIVKEPASQEKKITIQIAEGDSMMPNGDNREEKIVEWGGMKVDISGITPGFGCAKGMFEMMPDFDEPLEGFKEYMH